MKNCPFCGSTLHDEAEFCYYCMKEIKEKQNTQQKKEFSKKVIFIPISVIIVVAIIVSAVFITGKTKEKSTPTFNGENVSVTFSDYKDTAVAVTDKLNCTALWNPEALEQDETNETWTHYTSATAISGVNFGLMLDSESDDAVITLENIPKEKLRDALNIAICGVDAYYGYYLTDIDVFFLDDVTYPFTDCEYDYFDRYADVMGKNDRFKDAYNSGSKITSQYKQSQIEGEKNVIVYELRSRGNDNIYDITILFYEP